MAREKVAKTKTDKLIKGLLSLDYVEVPSKNKYRIFKHGLLNETYVLVGSHGALRSNNKPVAVNSRSVDEKRKDAIIKAGESK